MTSRALQKLHVDRGIPLLAGGRSRSADRSFLSAQVQSEMGNLKRQKEDRTGVGVDCVWFLQKPDLDPHTVRQERI